MNSTEHWASQIIEELFGEENISKERNTLLCKDIESSQAGSSFSIETRDILCQNRGKENNANEFRDCISDSGSTRTLNELFSISSPERFTSDIIASSSPLPDRLDYLNIITHRQFSGSKYFGCMDELNLAHLKKKKMNSDRQDSMNYRTTGISEPLSSRVASQHGDSERENSRISVLKTSVENNCEFWSGDGILSNETSESFLDDETERKITKYKMELIVGRFRKIGRLFEVCFVVPLASFIANNSEFLEFCVALLFCTVYAFIWPKIPNDKSSRSRTKVLTSENLKDSDTKELTETKEKAVVLREISTSSAEREDICPPRTIIQDEEQDILNHAEIKTFSDRSLQVLGDSGEKTQRSYFQVTPKISSVHDCADTASALEFFENSAENLELDKSNCHSSLDYTIDFVAKDYLQDAVLDTSDLPKNSVERKITSSSEVSQEAIEAPIIDDDLKEEKIEPVEIRDTETLEAPLNSAPIICDDVKVLDKIKSVKDSSGHSEIVETEGTHHEVESYKSEDESRDNVLSDVCVGNNTDYGWRTDIKVEHDAENGSKESKVCAGNNSELGGSTDDIKEEHDATENGLSRESDGNERDVNMDDSFDSLEDGESTGGMDQDHLADASLEVNFSMDGLHPTNELPELDDESIVEDGPEGIPPYPDPSYQQPDSNKPDELQHMPSGKSKTLPDLNSNPSSIFLDPISKRTSSSFPGVFKLEESRFPPISNKDSMIGDRLRDLETPASCESFEAATPLDSECPDGKKKKKGGGMKKRISFIFRNIRHLTHSAKENGYQKHRDM